MNMNKNREVFDPRGITLIFCLPSEKVVQEVYLMLMFQPELEASGIIIFDKHSVNCLVNFKIILTTD